VTQVILVILALPTFVLLSNSHA